MPAARTPIAVSGWPAYHFTLEGRRRTAVIYKEYLVNEVLEQASEGLRLRRPPFKSEPTTSQAGTPARPENAQ